MKLNKIVTAMFAVLTLAAASCTKVEPISGNATVGFTAPEIEYGMGNEYIYIPIQTTGEAGTYPIRVTVAVKAYDGAFAAVEDVDYLITSKEILVASPESTPKVEVRLLNPEDADELRFALTIASYENAAGVSVGETLVKCAKSDLDRLCGTWTWTGDLDGEAYDENWTISNNGSQLLIAGTFGEDGPLVADYDPETGVIAFGLGAANYLAGYNFTGLGAHYVAPVLYDGQYVYTSGTVEGVVNETLDEIRFDMDGFGVMLALFNPDTNEFAGYVYKGPFNIAENTIRKVKK